MKEYVVLLVCAICITTYQSNGLKLIDIPKEYIRKIDLRSRLYSRYKVKPFKPLRSYKYKFSRRQGSDVINEAKDKTLKEKIGFLIEQTINDAKKELDTIQPIKMRYNNTAGYRIVLADIHIEEVLNDSEFDFSGDDSDDDPMFLPSEITKTGNIESETSSSSDEEENVPDPPVTPTVSFSDVSEIVTTKSSTRGRSRGRARSSRGCGRGRGRGRGRGAGSSAPAQSPSSIQTRASVSGVQDNWSKEHFQPEIKPLTEPAYKQIDYSEYEWYQFYDQYIDADILFQMIDATNRTHILNTGKSLGLTLRELNVYIGITLVMSALQYPQIDMYWSERWRVPFIAQAMTRNRFFFIRKRLKCVYDNEVTSEQRKNKIWKVKPLFDRILSGCYEQDRPQELSIDEMIIPFTGQCSMRQYCPNKPNPVGLKVFVLATPQGVVCDMVVYQGDSTFPDPANNGFSLGESAVLALTRTLVPGHVLFFDRYFTTAKLCDELLRRGFHGTGTVMRNRVPKDCILTDEKLFRKKDRGSSEMKVRNDEKIALTTWLDNKPVLLMSTCYGDQKQDSCERWSKKKKCYETVKRPEVIKMYNKNMGGVDLADRMLSVCPSRNRTKKWTIRVISHLFDLAVVNAWLRYKSVSIQKGIRKKHILQLRQYKLDLGTKFIADNEESDDDDRFSDYEELEPKHKKRRILIQPVPTQECRSKQAAHLPKYNTEKQHRCRKPGCEKKTTVFCQKCKIFLCFMPSRNCFSDFHETDE